MANSSDWTRGNFKKTSNDVSFGVRDTGSLFHSKPKVPGFADGTPGGLSDGEWARGENYGDGTTGDERVAMARDSGYKEPGMSEKEPGWDTKSSSDEPAKAVKKQSFSEAFKAAKDGSTFEWNGKQYKKEYASKPAASKKEESADEATSSSSSKSFSEDVAERKRNMVSNAMSRNENYGNESRRPAKEPVKSGRGVIDTSNIDPKTLLPRR